MLKAMGVCLIPVPIIDTMALTRVQVNLLRNLSEAYGIKFSRYKVKNLIATLVGRSLILSLSVPVASFMKIIPVVGQTVGSFGMSVSAGATTYALGKVFANHFASGGTLQDFNSEEKKEDYENLVKKGKEVVSELKKKTEPL